MLAFARFHGDESIFWISKEGLLFADGSMNILDRRSCIWMSAARGHWERCSGVLYAGKMLVKLKGNIIYRTLKDNGNNEKPRKRLEVNKMKTLRSMCEVTNK